MSEIQVKDIERWALKQSGRLETECLTGGVEIIEQLAAEWRKLCEEGPCDEPFYRPELIAAFVRAFASEKELLVITARAGGRLRAVLPLIQEQAWFYGVPIRKLRSVTNLHTSRFDLVHGAGDEVAASVLTIWQRLKQTPGWDVIEAEDVPQQGAFNHLLVAASLDGYPTGRWVVVPTPYIPLPGPGGSLETVLSHLSKKFRSNLRRRMKKLEAQGAVRLVRVVQANQAALDRFYELERAGWKGKEGTAIACDAQTRQYYDGMARAAAQFGYFSLYALECDARPIAIHYGLAHRGRYYVPKLAYDETYRDFSPGHLLVHEVLRDLIEQGMREFDFLGPWMEWKGEWTSKLRPHANCYVFGRGIRGRALWSLKFQLMQAARRLKRKLKGEPLL
jgi:CelD/BcsL family acetyltransferase involved in cellulose biosynthesis